MVEITFIWGFSVLTQKANILTLLVVCGSSTYLSRQDYWSLGGNQYCNTINRQLGEKMLENFTQGKSLGDNINLFLAAPSVGPSETLKKKRPLHEFQIVTDSDSSDSSDCRDSTVSSDSSDSRAVVTLVTVVTVVIVMKIVTAVKKKL